MTKGIGPAAAPVITFDPPASLVAQQRVSGVGSLRSRTVEASTPVDRSAS